ncbi:MAG: DUF3299 domain-containing protein [Moraxellaceae bacterium]|nr:DUF3299 domain-containing protein [Moraxellaceae bacterium]
MKRILFCLLLLAPAVQAADKSAAKPVGKAGSSIVTLGWPQLVPDSERAKLVNPASIDHGKGPDRPRSSPLGGSAMGGSGPLTGDDVFNVLENQRSTPVYNPVRTWHNKSVRIPGYIVPIDYNAKGAIISFFLVPYFGACIHVPPPPPNQIIFVRYPKGFDTAALYEPFWISGTLKVETMQSEIAESLYTMQGLRIDPYMKPQG